MKENAKSSGYDEEYIFSKLSKERYEQKENGGKKIKATAKKTVTKYLDHFHTVMKDIFFVNGYENEIAFSKSKFVNKLGLKICPYCGRAYIFVVDGGKVKPQIDHFLPKSKYPFLSLAFNNLFPICQTCNMKDCKGDSDPLTDTYDFRLQNPRQFDSKKIIFRYNIKDSGTLDDSTFEVNVSYNGDKNLEDGYNNDLKIDQFYGMHNDEVASLYQKINKEISFYYDKIDIKSATEPENIFGYSLNDKNSRKFILYKFKEDIYHQIYDEEVKKKIGIK